MEGLGVHLLKRLWDQEYEDGEQRFQISAHDLQVWAFLLRRGIKVSVPRPLLPSDHDLERVSQTAWNLTMGRGNAT